MDIVTHAMSGLIIAGPFVSTHPMAASAFVFGTVLPDLDVLSRCFGKRAFLRWHQTYTHSFVGIVVAGLACMAFLGVFGVSAPLVPIALSLGMLVHILADWSNTYGVMLFGPLYRRRYSLSWVFFIDFTVIAVSLAALVPILIALWRMRLIPAWPTIGYICFVLSYWLVKGWFRRRALRLVLHRPCVLVPSALLPWSFYCYAVNGDKALLYRINVITGRRDEIGEEQVLDSHYANLLAEVPEYNLMRELSPGYHVVSASVGPRATTLVCRDLRTRNFGGKFGMLELAFDGEGNLQKKVFHV